MLYAGHGYDHIENGLEYGMAQAADYTANRYHRVSDEYSPQWDVSGALMDLQL
jgi:hypothetical protein